MDRSRSLCVVYAFLAIGALLGTWSQNLAFMAQPDNGGAVGFIRARRRFPVQETTVALFNAALRTKQRYGIHYWDAAIIEASRALGCTHVLSEDLSDGQDYGGVQVTNPFR
jgi:hypothetical protein